MPKKPDSSRNNKWEVNYELFEALLQRCFNGRRNPYQWVARAVSSRSQMVLNIGPGGVLRELYSPDRIILSMDQDFTRLAQMYDTIATTVIQAETKRLPFLDSCFDAITTVTNISLIDSFDEVLKEIARVLKPGGLLAIVVPAIGSSSPADMMRKVQLSFRLKTSAKIPGEGKIPISLRLGSAGLTKVEDCHENYRFLAHSLEDVELLMNGLHLTKDDKETRSRLENSFERKITSRNNMAIKIPMRRVLALK